MNSKRESLHHSSQEPQLEKVLYLLCPSDASITSYQIIQILPWSMTLNHVEVVGTLHLPTVFYFGLNANFWIPFSPTGGFAHSYGLEAAIQAHIISGPEDLKTHAIHVLENTGSLLLPFVYTANKSPDMETWSRLDKMLEATLTNEVSRRASVSQGSALLRVAATVFSEVPSLKNMRDALLVSRTLSFHHAPVFGLVCGLVGIDSETTQRAYMFITLRDVISAATRLNLVGPLGAAVLQHQIALVAEEMVQKWMDRPVEEACQTAPLLDIVQGCHGYLFSKMFCS